MHVSAWLEELPADAAAVAAAADTVAPYLSRYLGSSAESSKRLLPEMQPAAVCKPEG